MEMEQGVKMGAFLEEDFESVWTDSRGEKKNRQVSGPDNRKNHETTN